MSSIFQVTRQQETPQYGEVPGGECLIAEGRNPRRYSCGMDRYESSAVASFVLLGIFLLLSDCMPPSLGADVLSATISKSHLEKHAAPTPLRRRLFGRFSSIPASIDSRRATDETILVDGSENTTALP